MGRVDPRPSEKALHRMKARLPGVLFSLALGSFLLAVGVYSWFSESNDTLYVLPLFVLIALHRLLGWFLPETLRLGRYCEIFSSVGLLVIGLCWLCFGLCRADIGPSSGIDIPNLHGVAHGLSLGALLISFILVIAVWSVIVQLVKHPEDLEGHSNGWHEELRRAPTYSVVLLFATLWQVICLLGFSLALHDMPSGRGLKSSSEEVPLGSILFATTPHDGIHELSIPTMDRLADIVDGWSAGGKNTRTFLTLTLPPSSDFQSSETWERVESALRSIDGRVGNYAVEVQILHTARSSRLRADNSTRLSLPSGTEAIRLSATRNHEPQLLDYLYFMTSTLVTTGYCDLVPISNYAKLLCTVANIYEVFFTVVFFGIVISVLLPQPPVKVSHETPPQGSPIP